MELVGAYNRANKIEHMHYITMESIINRVIETFRGATRDKDNRWKVAEILKEEMKNRGLDRYFQVELGFNHKVMKIDVHEVNRFNRPKECVIWN